MCLACLSWNKKENKKKSPINRLSCLTGTDTNSVTLRIEEFIENETFHFFLITQLTKSVFLWSIYESSNFGQRKNNRSELKKKLVMISKQFEAAQTELKSNLTPDHQDEAASAAAQQISLHLIFVQASKFVLKLIYLAQTVLFSASDKHKLSTW